MGRRHRVSCKVPSGILNKNYWTKRHRAILLFECEEWENVSLWKFGWVAGAQMSSRVGDDTCTFQFRWKKNWVYSFKLIPHFHVKDFRWSRNIGPHKQRRRHRSGSVSRFGSPRAPSGFISSHWSPHKRRPKLWEGPQHLSCSSLTYWLKFQPLQSPVVFASD